MSTSSSCPLTTHAVHCCIILTIIKWLELSNESSPPADRVVVSSVLVTVASILTTGLSLLTNNWKAGTSDQIRNVRKKGRKCETDAGNQIEDNSGSVLIELSARRKLRKEDATQLTVTLIAFSLFLHVVIVLLGSPFIR